MFFDRAYYSKKYSVPKKISAIHYLVIGRHKNYNFCSYFDREFVEKQYDLKNIHVVNFLLHGINLHLDPNKYFSTSWYCRIYKDVLYDDINPLFHYIKYGWAEARNPSSEFSCDYYLKKYDDVKKAELEPLKHYLQYGEIENRKIENVKKVSS